MDGLSCVGAKRAIKFAMAIRSSQVNGADLLHPWYINFMYVVRTY